jgi:hypothetical protein
MKRHLNGLTYWIFFQYPGVFAVFAFVEKYVPNYEIRWAVKCSPDAEGGIKIKNICIFG